MGEPQLLTQFFGEHADTARDEFLARFPGAFILSRFHGTPPQLMFLPRQDGFKLSVGADEDCDFSFELDQTLDGRHATIAYHPGFRGWTVSEDTKSNFGTTVDGERLGAGRPLLLQDRQVIKLGVGMAELQFYSAETLWTRMNKAGITRSSTKKHRQAPASAADDGSSTPDDGSTDEAPALD
jgi:pSer/pThr/pTyr-binding forkhead associated (FHA) protein